MLDYDKSKKLVELTSKAISINEQLLLEEKKFVEAVSQRKDERFLRRISNKIKSLIRKGCFLELLEACCKRIRTL